MSETRKRETRFKEHEGESHSNRFDELKLEGECYTVGISIKVSPCIGYGLLTDTSYLRTQ